MPDQTTTFTPYRLDLTGLRAGQVVNYAGVLYDVEKVEIRETLGGRNKDTGAPLMIETRVDVKLHRARWTDDPWIERPTPVIVLTDLVGQRKTVINGQAYFLHSFSTQLAYVQGLRRSDEPYDPAPEHIEVQLIRNPFEDPVIDVKCTCDNTPDVGEPHQQSCPGFSADVEQWADRTETGRG